MIRLLELRNENEWTQRELAKKLFVSQGTYNNWENGKTQPSIEQLILISNLFGVSIDYLVGNDNFCNNEAHSIKSRDHEEIINTVQKCLDDLKQKYSL